MAHARRSQLLRIHRRRLRPEDLEDCFSQATLELIAQARAGRAFSDRRHLANALEQRFLSRVQDRRRALAGRSPIAAAIEHASQLGAEEESPQLEDLRARLESLVILRSELARLPELAQLLSADQRLALAAQLAQVECGAFCHRFGWSVAKYRKTAQRGRARLRELLALEGGAVPPAPAPSEQSAGTRP